MINTNKGCLRVLAYLEGTSFLLLLGIGMPLKYLYEMPKPNMVIGLVHGVLFIAYCVWVIIVASAQKWSYSKAFLALLAAFLPFGTFVADNKLFRQHGKSFSKSNNNQSL